MLLAHASPEVRNRVLSAPLPAFTEHTITDQRTLRAALADVRRHGFAFCPAASTRTRPGSPCRCGWPGR
ncbi:IclR family transcriptional regulator C-terminal domain-containing protein [Nonomuraea sp. SYSU D8015]|uniref:IclR family transcriptional regulator C-terminal domain-containing protein n=1 Tax=Nonomuraea sp. SYSU D8015 TaxID=2593644 RepID=UPI0021D3B039|nr:IclR family transcriptional regulator C-terminal domain-containing protein [Nonomuraea sp. SYSU D8015]